MSEHPIRRFARLINIASSGDVIVENVTFVDPDVVFPGFMVFLAVFHGSEPDDTRPLGIASSLENAKAMCAHEHKENGDGSALVWLVSEKGEFWTAGTERGGYVVAAWTVDAGTE